MAEDRPLSPPRNSLFPTRRRVDIIECFAGRGRRFANQVSSAPTLTNVTFSGNTAGTNGGGVYNTSSSPTLTNVTFSGNTASGNCGGMYNTGSSPILTNVVSWGNSGGGPDVFNSASTPVIAYTCSQQDLTGFGATNETLNGSTNRGDPFDVGPGGELFLIQNSVCVDSGDDTAATSAFGSARGSGGP